MDIKTLKVLLMDAKSQYAAASKEFEKTDNSDAMHEMDAWKMTSDWIGEYIAGDVKMKNRNPEPGTNVKMRCKDKCTCCPEWEY